MTLDWTETQHKRLVELDADAHTLAQTFADADQRNSAFQAWEKARVSAGRRHLDLLRNGSRRPRLCRVFLPFDTATPTGTAHPDARGL